MRFRRIGALDVSVVALGCNNFNGGYDPIEARPVVDAAIDAGVNYFDTAESYGGGRSEEVLGKVLPTDREGLVIATKYDGPPDAAASHAEASMRRLGVDHIDLFTLHHPQPDVPVAETIGALRALVDAGKIREFGCSNFELEPLRAAAAAKGDGQGFVSVQNDYNLLNRKMEFSVIPECAATGVAFTAYFPLYHGFLTGDFQRGAPVLEGTRLAKASAERQAAVFTDEHFDVLEGLRAFASRSGHSVLEVALARLLAEPGVAAVLPGAAFDWHARANAAAADWELTPAEVAEVDRLAPSDPNSKDTPSAAHGIK